MLLELSLLYKCFKDIIFTLLSAYRHACPRHVLKVGHHRSCRMMKNCFCALYMSWNLNEILTLPLKKNVYKMECNICKFIITFANLLLRLQFDYNVCNWITTFANGLQRLQMDYNVCKWMFPFDKTHNT